MLIFPHHLVSGDIFHMIDPDVLVVPHRQVPGSASHQQNVFLKIEEGSGVECAAELLDECRCEYKARTMELVRSAGNGICRGIDMLRQCIGIGMREFCLESGQRAEQVKVQQKQDYLEAPYLTIHLRAGVDDRIDRVRVRTVLA